MMDDMTAIQPRTLSIASTPRSSTSAALAAVVFTIGSWASAFPLIRIGLRELTPLQLASARFAVAGLIIGAWLVWRRAPLPTIADAGRFLACGFVGIGLYNGLLNMGQQTVTAGAASFIVNTVPIITLLLATLLRPEPIMDRGWLGTCVGFAGVGLIASGQPGGLGFGGGASLVLAAAACQAVFFTIQRPLVDRYGALASSAYTLLVGAIVLLPWLPAAGDRAVSGGLTGTTIAAVTALGIFPAALGYAAWSCVLGHFGAVRASNFLYLVPPVATIVAIPMTGEVPGPTTIAGGIAAIAGVALVNTRGRS